MVGARETVEEETKETEAEGRRESAEAGGRKTVSGAAGARTIRNAMGVSVQSETETEGRRGIVTEAEGRRETVIEAEGRKETAEAVTGETVAGGMPRMRAPDKAGVPGRGTVLSRRLIS